MENQQEISNQANAGNSLSKMEWVKPEIIELEAKDSIIGGEAGGADVDDLS